MSQHIGLFFGSFNPIHVGHLIIANTMVELSDLDKVWFVVSPQNPFKPAKGLLHEFDRYDMVGAAIADNHKLEASDVEFHLPRPSYTIHTLRYLSEKFPDKKFSPIIGEDNLGDFNKWKEPEAILAQFGLYVYPRPNSLTTALHNHPNVKIVKAPMMDISATFIRQCIRDRKSIRYMVPDVVEEIIQRKGFYL